MPDDVQPQWDDQTDSFIKDIDTTVTAKRNISLRALLLDPQKFASTPNIAATIKEIKLDVDAYFTELFSNLTQEEQELVSDMEKVDSIYTQVNQTINNRAGIGRVPFLKPEDMDFGSSNPETIYISQYSGQIDALITKLINTSNYICDLSTTYRKYTLGSWLFSGSRSYVLSVQAPESPIISIENARDQINTLIDEVSIRIASI